MWLGKMLGYDGDGRLIVTEHEAVTEKKKKGWNLGVDMDLCISLGLGINNYTDSWALNCSCLQHSILRWMVQQNGQTIL